MTGRHSLVIYNKFVHYELEVARSITIIRGDSATGKTTLVNMLRSYADLREGSGITCICDKNVRVLEGPYWMETLGLIHDSIVFIDEDNSFCSSKEFARAIQDTDNYYVIIQREPLPSLPYSIDSVYELVASKYYRTYRQTYNTAKLQYSFAADVPDRIDRIITEDKKSGGQFLAGAMKGTSVQVILGEGNSTVYSIFKKLPSVKMTLLVVDSAAFGPYIDALYAYICSHDDLAIFAPESFEWLVLKSGIVPNFPMKILDSPEDYIESSEYFSWERFFTTMLQKYTENLPYRYTKSRLHPFYMDRRNATKILKLTPLASHYAISPEKSVRKAAAEKGFVDDNDVLIYAKELAELYDGDSDDVWEKAYAVLLEYDT